MRDFKTTVIQHNNFFYLVDLHSRDMRGLSNGDGTSVLLKFASLLDVRAILKLYI